MPDGPRLTIRQHAPVDGKFPIRLTLHRPGQPELEAEAAIEFALSPQEQEELRWYLEDYLEKADIVEAIQIEQIESLIRQRGIELYEKMLEGSRDVQRIFGRVLDELADLRVEIRSEIVEAASIPWELLREPQTDSPIALRVKSFVRVQSDPNLSFVQVPEADRGRIRLLYVVCRPRGANDVGLRAIANRLLQDLRKDLARFEIKALRPPTYKQLQKELQDAKASGHPYHIVHFDGHGDYADLSNTELARWINRLSCTKLGRTQGGKHGYLCFENPGTEENLLPVFGDELGKLLHDTGVPVLVLNACQSAMHEAREKPEAVEDVHDEVRAIGSLAQIVIDQGVPAVLGMRYSVFVVTAAQYMGELYASLAKGRSFGQAATDARKHLQRNPHRWVGLQRRPLQDWCVPIVYEAAPLQLLSSEQPLQLDDQPEMDPVQVDQDLLQYVPDQGFIGRDETLLMLDRAFDDHRVVLLYAYAGQGKTATAVEFARWYARTRGLGPRPVVLFTSFEHYKDLGDILNQVGHTFSSLLQAYGIEWHALNESEERRKIVLQLLREVPVLWIWDNVEPVAGFPAGAESAWTAEEQEELAGFLKQIKEDNATEVKILLTSRRDEQQWLHGIPYRVPMQRMSHVDGAGLALKLGEIKGLTRGEIADWGPLLDYCGGNPLTLRVVAGQAVKMGLRGREQIEQFIQSIRDGEQHIEDVDESEGRDKSLAASLDYGSRHAFNEDETLIIALLHLFQGMVDVHTLELMGRVGDHGLPEVPKYSREQLASLLERAGDIGLLVHLGSTQYRIHPAVPWFLRQLFARHYNGQDGHSSAEAALRSWVEAEGELSNFHHSRFIKGQRQAISALALEEDNLLHARRVARREGWWRRVISAMQGLEQLYECQGRTTEWARLVTEIVRDFCTKDEEPVSGREEDYGLVMGYRVRIAADQNRDLAHAQVLQEKVVAWSRAQAAAALALPKSSPLDNVQTYQIRNLSVALSTLANIQCEKGNGDCVHLYREAIEYDRRIGHATEEAICHFNLGHAYKNIPSIRDLDAAEREYHRSLELTDPDDSLGRSRCLHQIGAVSHDRFRDALQDNQPEERQFRHARKAQQYYQRGLGLCPVDAVSDLAKSYNVLGSFFLEIDAPENAQPLFEECLKMFEKADDSYGAGQTRNNLALIYWRSAVRTHSPKRKKELLLRAHAYAEASLRDFQHFHGHCASEETKVRGLLDAIEQQLATLSK